MPSDDEQPHDSIRKRDVDPTDSKRLQLYWYSQKHSKATQKELTLWFYTIQETNQLQLSSSEIHITRQLLNHSFHYYNRIQTQYQIGRASCRERV